MERVLEGVKVLEVSGWAFVPSCGAVLADWGADVIKVEPPTGDPMRGLVPAGLTSENGPSVTWELFNRGKRSVVLDLSHAEARAIVLRLAAEADVFLTSYLPSARAKLGIDVDDLRAVNPTIIYASGSGYGPNGDEAGKGAFDVVTFWARGGAAQGATPAGSERPAGLPSGAFGDSISGMTLAGSVAAALVRKARTGEGAVVEVALLGTAMWAMQMGIGTAAAMAFARGRREIGASSVPMIANPLVHTYRTKDERWISLCMLQGDRYWDGVLAALGREDLREDDRFVEPATRRQHLAEAVAALTETIAAMTLDEVKAKLATQPGQWDVVTSAAELPRDPQVLANHFVHPVTYDDGFELPMVASPARFDRTPVALGPAPEFGADTDDVLLALGMDMDAILEAKIAGAVF